MTPNQEKLISFVYLADDYGRMNYDCSIIIKDWEDETAIVMLIDNQLGEEHGIFFLSYRKDMPYNCNYLVRPILNGGNHALIKIPMHLFQLLYA